MEVAFETQRSYLGGRSRRTQTAAADWATAARGPQSAAATVKYSLPFCTVKLPPLQNDVLEIRCCETRPQLQHPSSNDQLNWLDLRAATASTLGCLKRQVQCSVMLSLNGLPCCESSVMKASLNCLESARVSAAATGSIGSIFDVSMGRRRSAAGRQRPRPVGVPLEAYKGSLCALRARGAAPITTAPSDFFVHVAFPRNRPAPPCPPYKS